jgi:hypothetical protein
MKKNIKIANPSNNASGFKLSLNKEVVRTLTSRALLLVAAAACVETSFDFTEKTTDTNPSPIC